MTAIEGSSAEGVPGPPRRAKPGGLGRSYLLTIAGSVGMIACNLYTGVLSARLLNPDGRGVVGAIVAWSMMIAYLSGFGLREGMIYLESRDHRRAPVILSTTVLAAFVTGLIGLAVAELFVPVGFRAQSDSVITQARIFMVFILPLVAMNFMASLMQGRQRFVAMSVMRVGQPLLYALGLTMLWAVGTVSVTSLLSVQIASVVVSGLVAFTSLYRESGMGPLDGELARESLSYGFRAFGSTLGAQANSRLDQLMLPALVGPAEIGYYVVAVSATSMIVGLMGSLNLVVFPAASRVGGKAAVAITQRAIRLVLACSAVMAIVLGVLADPLVHLLYGDSFQESVQPMRLLLLSVSLWSAYSIVSGSLKALGRPGLASISQFVGVAVTAVGLLVLLRPMGIEGAALASSLSYATVFVVGLIQFNRVTGTTVGGTLHPKLFLRDGSELLSKLRHRVGRPAT